jgi:hypothetical protein
MDYIRFMTQDGTDMCDPPAEWEPEHRYFFGRDLIAT